MIVGFTSTPLPDWQKYVVAPAPRKGTKDEVKQREQIQKKIDELAATAHQRPLLAALTSVFLLYDNGEVCTDFIVPDGKPLGAALGIYIRGMLADDERLVGFDVSSYMEIAALEAVCYQAYSGVPGGVFTIPFAYWREGPFADDRHLVDPYKLLVPSKHQATSDLPALCRYLGIGWPGDDEFNNSAEVKARLALEVCTKTGIL